MFPVATVEVALGLLGLVVGLVALPLGVFEGRRQIRRMGEVHDGLESAIGVLRGEVETHHIGVFPFFLPRITEMLAGAEESIEICCDLPAYGVVSSPDCFDEYAKLVEDKTKEVDVRMLHLDKTGRMASLKVQFAEPWEELRENPIVASFVASSAEPLDEHDPKGSFLTLVQKRQVETLERFEAADVSLDPSDLIMPLYFWIADGRKAIFALTEFSSRAYEVGFSTGSTDLISALRGIYTRYQTGGTAAKRGGRSPATVTEAS